jgi:trk system potassium uptake protein TrkH
MWYGSFQAISGFNNAGFTILPDSSSLSGFSTDPLILGIMAVLIALGGLSFPVMSDLLHMRRFSRFSLDTKMVLTASFSLWVLGAAVIFAFEYNKPETLGPMGLGYKFMNALFNSVSSRAAGFSSIEIGQMGSATAFFVIGLMFIGTASASVGGGIRLNTFGVLIATVFASIQAKDHVIAFGRELSSEQVHRAIAIVALASIFIGFVAFVLTLTESQENLFLDLFFETVSALGTVGLSRGITGEISTIGQLLLIGSMLCGRLGPLMLAISLAPREMHPTLYRYARERVNIG